MDVKLYSTLLTDATILALASKINKDPNTVEDYASLKAWYKLDSSTADSKGSHTLTAVGSPASDYDAFSVIQRFVWRDRSRLRRP